MRFKLNKYKLIFWDFDGVIKESVSIKEEAIRTLFLSFREELVYRICEHNALNPGMSRFEKIPIYLAWAGQDVNEQTVTEYCQRFSDLVKTQVVNAPWVMGVERIIRENPYDQEFIIVTATPQGEINEILNRLGISQYFTNVFGSPIAKSVAINKSLLCRNIPREKCLVIGDAKVDIDAALGNNLSFLLRRHYSNYMLLDIYDVDFVENFEAL